MQSARAEQRRGRILEQARREGHLVVSDLAEQLAVVPETVRRDLKVLAGRGQLRRTHGNAYPVPAAVEKNDPNVSDAWSVEKCRIAGAAVERLGLARTVFLDSSDTHQLIASLLAASGRILTVLTASLTCAAILARAKDIEVILLGGRLHSSAMATTDHWAVSMLNQFHVDLAIMGADGFALETGATVVSSRTAAISHCAMTISSRRFFVGDHSKFDVRGAFRFAEIGDFDLVLSDLQLPTAVASQISARGPEVIRV